ncbi:SMI1/KNR4 family protein [Lysinibacillus fusiformis]|uniref:SMI1/KNR4 family protein n=1 Tax=Lysinibacillus fusiformis TaxID=28031 RepID=UPI003CFD2549
MNEVFRDIDEVIENMRSFISEIQQQAPSFYALYPMIFHKPLEDVGGRLMGSHWQLPDEYLYFLKHYVVEGITWNTGDYINLQIFGATDLMRGQDGYNYNPVTEEVISDWPQHYVVIATDEGDPYCIDLARGDTAIFTAYHGTGSWDFEMAYDNLVAFLQSVLVPSNLEEEQLGDHSYNYYEMSITGNGKDKLNTLLLLRKRLSCDYSTAKKSLEQTPLLIYRGVEAGAVQLEKELQAISADYQKRKISLAEFLT